jgi:hypothetical protein
LRSDRERRGERGAGGAVERRSRGGKDSRGAGAGERAGRGDDGEAPLSWGEGMQCDGGVLADLVHVLEYSTSW